jgi:hypothetical protein
LSKFQCRFADSKKDSFNIIAVLCHLKFKTDWIKSFSPFTSGSSLTFYSLSSTACKELHQPTEVHSTPRPWSLQHRTGARTPIIAECSKRNRKTRYVIYGRPLTDSTCSIILSVVMTSQNKFPPVGPKLNFSKFSKLGPKIKIIIFKLVLSVGML